MWTALLVLSLILLAACGGGGGSSSSSSDDDGPELSFSLEDAPTDTFSTVRLRVDELRLEDGDGLLSANLLGSPREFDLLGLAAKSALLALIPSFPDGSYPRVHLTVGHAEVLDLGGLPVPVTIVQGAGSATVPGAGIVLDGGYLNCALDVDLDASFREDPGAPGSFLFELRFNASDGIPPAFDGFRGRVTAIDRARSRFTARLIDDGSATSFGELQVLVEDGDFLVHDDGRTFATADAFLDELDVGEIVQVNGRLLPSGLFDASRVIEEDDDGLSGSSRIEFEGEVLSLDPVGQTFQLLIKEVEKGEAIAGPVLAGLPNPNLIEVAYDAATLIVADDSGSSGAGLVDLTLVPGLEVDVRFASFALPSPFLATSIEVGDGSSGGDDGIEYEGTIVDVADLPSSFRFALQSSEPAVLTGLVTAPVLVPLSSAPTIELDAGPEPILAPDDLLLNLRAKVYGELSGPPANATLTPTRIKVKPGRLEGTLTAVDLGGRTLTVTVDEVDRSFGGPVTPTGSVVFEVPASAEIETDAGGTALVDLAGLLGGAAVSIRLEGIALVGGGFRAWEVEER